MSITSSRIARTAVAASVVLAAALVAAPSAVSAAPLSPRVFFTADLSVLDGNPQGLYYVDSPGATPVPVVEDYHSTVSSVTASANGKFIAYVQILDFGNGTRQQDVVVRDLFGRVIRVATSVDPASLTVVSPALSADGSYVGWTEIDSMGVNKAYVEAVTAGAPKLLSTDAFLAGFRSISGAVVGSTTSASGTYDVYDSATGLKAGTQTLVPNALSLVVSPDSSQLAYVGYSAAATPSSFTGSLIAMGSGSGTSTILLPGDASISFTSPSYTPDGANLLVLGTVPSTGSADIFTTQAGGGTTTKWATTAYDETSVAVTQPDAVAPGAVVTNRMDLAGTSLSIQLSLPLDTDIAGILVTRSSGTAPLKSWFVAGRPTSIADSGLVLGTRYTYGVQAVDTSGNIGPEFRSSALALMPSPSAADPTSSTSAKATFPVRFAAPGWTVPSVVRVAAEYRRNNGAWLPWIWWVPESSATFGVAGDVPANTPFGLSTGTYSTTSIPGSTYRFRVQMFDVYTGVSRMIESPATVVPFDQGKAVFSKATTTVSASAYLGSFRTLSAAGATAKLSVVGNRLQVIGGKCSVCGVFDVFDGATRIGTVDTRSATTLTRAVLFTKTWATSGTHAITVKARGTAGRPQVRLDAFGVRV